MHHRRRCGNHGNIGAAADTKNEVEDRHEILLVFDIGQQYG